MLMESPQKIADVDTPPAYLLSHYGACADVCFGVCSISPYMMWCVFNIFGSRKKNSPIKPPRGPGETVRPEDIRYLEQWTAQHGFVEGFVEPETLVNEMSVVLVAENGEFTRRRIGGPKGIDVVAKQLGIALYDVEETGYPDRMRKRMEQERILRKRAEQKERRARFERGE